MRFGEKDKRNLEKVFLVDGHAHLDELNDLDESLRAAKAAGIGGIIAVGVDIESNKKILNIAKENRGYVYPAFGYHPWQIEEEEVEKNISFIQDHEEESVAIGEIGLDYKIKLEKRIQWEVFSRLLEIALKSNKPVIVHCRYSHRRAFDMVKEKGIRGAVFHWYTGSIELLGEILAMGYSISATPALIYSPPHQEAIKRAPLERILLETDTPVSYQGREARPQDVRITLEEVARLKSLDPLMVSEQTTVNASKLFKISFGERAL